MKKFATMFVLSLLMVWGGQAMAQTKGYLSLSAAFPMGKYAKGDINEWALTNASLDSRYAGASIGANVGLKMCFGVGVPGLSVMLSADGFFNGLNNNLKEHFDQHEIDLKNNPLISSFTVNRPRYFNVPIMAGLNHIVYFSPSGSFGMYFEAAVGANARFITDNYESIKYAANVATTTTNYDYKTAFSFAYQVGIGFEAAKSFVFGVSFYDLGASKVTAERTLPIVGTDIYKNEKGVRPQMLLARIGFKF